MFIEKCQEYEIRTRRASKCNVLQNMKDFHGKICIVIICICIIMILFCIITICIFINMIFICIIWDVLQNMTCVHIDCVLS